MDRTTLVTGMPIRQTVEWSWITYYVVTNISTSIVTLLDIETQNTVEIAQETFDISASLQVATKEEMDAHLKAIWDNVKTRISAIRKELEEALNYETKLLANKMAVCKYFK